MREAAMAESAHADRFAAQRPLLLGVAYRVLGRVADAEDVVQEAWIRWSAVDPATVKDPRAFLVRVATRLALDRLRRIKARHEEYVGPWLPEPLLTQPDPTERVERTEAISLALLVVLESLSPLERAVFVLREAFGYSHAEIADILGRHEAAVRQLATRARTHVQARRPRFDSDPGTRRRVTERFLQATSRGDLAGLLEVLAPGVTLVADSGGLVRAPRVPLHGADSVGRFLLAIRRPEATASFLRLPGPDQLPDLRVVPVELNGEPGIVVMAAGRPIGALGLQVGDERVQAIHLIANPEKLRGVADAHRTTP
jgi:RNA polymerase sigma-70 factor, ECF subfamily